MCSCRSTCCLWSHGGPRLHLWRSAALIAQPTEHLMSYTVTLARVTRVGCKVTNKRPKHQNYGKEFSPQQALSASGVPARAMPPAPHGSCLTPKR